MLLEGFHHGEELLDGEELLGAGNAGLSCRDESSVRALAVRTGDTELIANAVSGVLDAGSSTRL